MPYTTLQDLTDKFGERMLIRLTDRDELATDTINTDVVDRAIADTDALIDGHVKVRYALPMAEVPPLVSTLALDIVIYKLHVLEPDPKIKADYDAAMKSLRSISDGTIRLPLATGGDAAGSGSSGARVTDRDRPFTADKMKGFI